MFRSVHPRLRIVLVISAVAGVVIAVWLTAPLAGWDEDGVVGWIPEPGLAAAVVIVALLVADTVLPIPATLLMLASGAAFGPVTGSVVNALGLLIAAIAGYALGRTLPSTDIERRSMRPLSVAMTRGVPVLSESFAIGAGVVGVPLPRFIHAATAGAIAVGAVYSTAGWLATDHWSLIIAAVALASIAYLVAVQAIARPAQTRTRRRSESASAAR